MALSVLFTIAIEAPILLILKQQQKESWQSAIVTNKIIFFIFSLFSFIRPLEILSPIKREKGVNHFICNTSYYVVNY